MVSTVQSPVSDDKDPDAYRTIKEVGDMLDLPHHVIRFWETRFSQLKPMKRGGGRRYYRPEDVMFLRGIRHLLYSDGYTIKGVQRLIKTRGVRFIQDIGERLHNAHVVPEQGILAGQGVPNTQQIKQNYITEVREAAREQAAQSGQDNHGLGGGQHLPMASNIGQNFRSPSQLSSEQTLSSSAPSGSDSDVKDTMETKPVVPSQIGLSPDNTRRLQAILFELIECKKTLELALPDED